MRLTFTLSDRGRELLRENMIRCKFPRQLREIGFPVLLFESISSFSSPRLVLRANQSTLDFEGRPDGNQLEEEPTGLTLVSLRERGVTCRRVNTVSCHKQKNVESNSPSTELTSLNDSSIIQGRSHPTLI